MCCVSCVGYVCGGFVCVRFWVAWVGGLLFGCLWMFSLLCHVEMVWCCLVVCYLLYDETIELLLNVTVGGFVCYVFDLLFGLGWVGLCWFVLVLLCCCLYWFVFVVWLFVLGVLG